MEGLDYHETFSHVAKLVTIRVLLAIIAIHNWPLYQLDVNNAFLHDDLQEEVYLTLPLVFSYQGENNVCCLNRSLYGLKQASRNWFYKFSSVLQNVGFQESKADYSLFTLKKCNSYIVVLIYVNDITKHCFPFFL